MSKHIEELLKALSFESPVFIQTHNYPDPDALASAYALQHLLQHFNRETTLCHVGDVEQASLQYIVKHFNINLECFHKAYKMHENDQIILVDGQKFNANMEDLPGDEVACIDHHPTYGDRECGYKYSDIRPVGACSSIIASYYFEADIAMPRDVATILLYGLQIDTDYMTRGVNELDVAMFSSLYNLANPEVLKKIANKSLKYKDLQAFSKAINGIEIHEPKIAFAPVEEDCPDALLGQIADFVLSLAEVDTAIIYCLREEGIKFSARTTKNSIHCGNLLYKVLGGGGHADMAGGFVDYKDLPDVTPRDLHALGAYVKGIFLEPIKTMLAKPLHTEKVLHEAR